MREFEVGHNYRLVWSTPRGVKWEPEYLQENPRLGDRPVGRIRWGWYRNLGPWLREGDTIPGGDACGGPADEFAREYARRRKELGVLLTATEAECEAAEAEGPAASSESDSESDDEDESADDG